MVIHSAGKEIPLLVVNDQTFVGGKQIAYKVQNSLHIQEV